MSDKNVILHLISIYYTSAAIQVQKLNMLNYKKYKIRADDNFQASDFPKVINELMDLNTAIFNIPAVYKKEILISFLKRHSLHADWLTSNPELSSIISKKGLATDHLESLFDSCQQNKQFLQQYEDYICESIS